MSFRNKVVLITGAGSGIGAATALAFAKQSANLSLVDINEYDLNKIVEASRSNASDVLKVVADVTSDDDLKRIIDDTIARFGKLDVLVNCAGIYIPANILNDNIMKIFDRIMAVNLRSIVALVNQAASSLIETKGSVVNICSVSANLTTKNNLAYSISKAGLMHFTRCAAIEFADKGVRVNTVSPGVVDTNIFNSAGLNSNEIKASIDLCLDNTPLKKMITPDEIAQLVVFLSSENARNITGSDYLIDGGMVLHGLPGQ